jgi:hypothetical protein
VEPAGVPAGEQGVAGDGVLADAGQPAGLAHAAAVGQVGEDGGGRRRRQAGVEQRGALALGEAGLAGAAAEQTAVVEAVAHGHGEVAVPALAVVGAVGVQAAEAAQVIVVRPSLAHRGSLASIGLIHHCQRWYKSPAAACTTERTPPACMHKLVMICHGVLKNRAPFDPDWASKTAP